MIEHSVYVLWSERLRKRYVGYTTNIDRRLREHNEGDNRFTKGGVPWIVVHREVYGSISEARERETFLKSGIGRAWLDALIPRYRR